MADNRVLLFVALFSTFLCSSFGYQFAVGGRNGWVVNPAENYNRWAERMRFQVNDTLLFQYKKGSNSVLVVNRDDYDKCNTANPIVKFDDGNSVFKFDKSGPFYFISGDKASCDQGQKLIIVVMAVRTPPQPKLPPTVVSPPTAAPLPGSASPPSPTGPSGSPISPSSPSPAGGAPTHLAPSPASGAPGPATLPSSPSPVSEAPGPSTTVSGPSPANASPDAPSSSVIPGSPGSSPGAPGSSMPGAPGSSTPGSGRPGDVSSPPAPSRSLAAPSGNPSIVLISAVMSVVLGGFMV